MRLAWFGPLPPGRSGIADYGVLILRALAAHAEVDLWVCADQPPPAPELARRYRVHVYHPTGAMPAQLAGYDGVIYNIGNHAGFHGPTYETLLRFPGIVILHDWSLHSLMVTHFLETRRDARGFRALVPAHYGIEGRRFVDELVTRTAQAAHAWDLSLRYPLNESVLRAATGVVTHSRFVEERLRTSLPAERIRRLAHPAFPVPGAPPLSRAALGLPAAGPIVATGGFVTANKGAHWIARTLPRGVHYLLLGEAPRGLAPPSGPRVQTTGFLPIEKVYAYLRHADVVINVRNPSMGETSASLLRALSVGRAAIVADLGWYRELPDDCVVKIAPDALPEQTPRAVAELLGDPARRARLGRAALDYLERECRPATFAAGLVDFARSKGPTRLAPAPLAQRVTRRVGETMIECGRPPAALVERVAAELRWLTPRA